MSEEIKVSVNSWGPGRSLTLSWVDPITDKRKTQSAKTKNWREAERLAGDKEKELAAGLVSPSRITWTEFERRYKEEKLTTLAPATQESALGSLRQVKRVLSIEYLAKLTASALSTFAAACRKDGMKDTTLAHHLRHIKAALRWAAKLGLMSKAPLIEMPKRAKGSQARSRAITTEEYERVLLAIPKARPQDSAQWARYITGLWLSGLRRSEALRLTWDQDEAFCVNLADEVFVIRADGQKSGKAETCPMAFDFADWLRTIPEEERTGRVFPLIDTRTNQPLRPNRVGKIVEAIGRKAHVKVGTRTKRDRKGGTTSTVPVFAGCHSYRRGFGSRWARLTTALMLMQMMRHSSIVTTQTYYVTMNAADVAKELRAKFGTPAPVDGLQQSSNKPPVDSIEQ